MQDATMLFYLESTGDQQKHDFQGVLKEDYSYADLGNIVKLTMDSISSQVTLLSFISIQSIRLNEMSFSWTKVLKQCNITYNINTENRTELLKDKN